MPEGRAEAVRTFLDQTKLLVGLASAFIVAAAVLQEVLRLANHPYLFIAAEAFFVLSVLFSYFVFGTIAADQHKGEFNVYRTATRGFSFAQLGAYLAGLICFVILMLPAGWDVSALLAGKTPPQPVPAPPPALVPLPAQPALTPTAPTLPPLTQPAATEPALTQPAATEPALTQPALTQPASQ